MGSIGGFEWVIIILVVLLFFGAKKIPELARGIGQGINEFRKASDDIRKEIERGNDSDREQARSNNGSETSAPAEKSKSETKSNS